MYRLKFLLLFVLTMTMSSVVYGGETSVKSTYEDGVTLTITTKPFDPKEHVINMCGIKVCGIDGQPLYGTYALMPKREVTSLVLKTKDKEVSLDVSGMYNPIINNSNIKKYIQVMPWHGGSYRITGYFSHDGDDSTYICFWMVTRGGTVRNYIGNYNALSNLMSQVQKDFNIPKWPPWDRHPDDDE